MSLHSEASLRIPRHAAGAVASLYFPRGPRCVHGRGGRSFVSKIDDGVFEGSNRVDKLAER